jgi:hypothetical protein
VRAYGLVGTVCALLVAGCGSSAVPKAAGGSALPSPVSSPSQRESPTVAASTSAPTPSPSRFRQAYANAFEDFFAAYTRADEAGDPASADLVRFSTESGLAWANKQISDHVKLGVAHRGYWQFRHLGAINVTKSSARVGQCMDWSHWPVVNRVTGVPLQRFAAWSQLVYADMVLTSGEWKVASIQVQAGAC